MRKTSQQQKPIREYDDVPLSPDFSKTGDDFVDHLMQQLPPLPDHLKDKTKDQS
ncbi:hypothetical protein [Paenibacillus sp. B2(2019)]|uniref:hypothetical protein n=1 Tax=Paenibacillus sp. B2(2019) TaxID=2607754 RepID=UPI00165EF950|nr:hypothetical protein [Paenibacillus sp. B2(2019)]